VSPVKYELGFYIPEDGILHSHRRENLKSYKLIKLVGSIVSAYTGLCFMLRCPCISARAQI
jgi:hypothetical protein